MTDANRAPGLSDKACDLMKVEGRRLLVVPRLKPVLRGITP